MMNVISSHGNKCFWRTSKHPRRIQFIKPPPEYPHLSFIYCLFCLPDTQLFNLSKDPYRLSEDLGLSEHWKLRQNNRYLQRIKENRRLIHTPLNELHTSSKVDTYAAQRVTYVIEGQYIRRSTSYICHRKSIQWSFFPVKNDTVSNANASGKICTPSEPKSHKTGSGSEST